MSQENELTKSKNKKQIQVDGGTYTGLSLSKKREQE